MSLGVVIPVYHVAADLLVEALQSISDQTSRDDPQVVVVDDGSDSYRETERACIASDLANLELVRIPHEGMAAARNEGVSRLESDFAVLLDADDLLAPQALANIEDALTPETHLLYADHIWCELDGTTVLAERRKGKYQALLAEYGQTKWSPFLHATFLFHPHVFRVETYQKLGGLGTQWGYGDEIELHLRIEQMFGYSGIAHVPRVLYLYRRNPASVVHKPELYKRLIDNIEAILLARMQQLDADVAACERIGRAASTHAAHYEYRLADGARLNVPWFDFDTQDLRD